MEGSTSFQLCCSRGVGPPHSSLLYMLPASFPSVGITGFMTFERRESQLSWIDAFCRLPLLVCVDAVAVTLLLWYAPRQPGPSQQGCKIVARHDGHLTARSVPGQGATFLVTLPTHQPEKERQP